MTTTIQPDDVTVDIKLDEVELCGGCQMRKSEDDLENGVTWEVCGTCQTSWHTSCIPPHLVSGTQGPHWVCPHCTTDTDSIYANSAMVPQ